MDHTYGQGLQYSRQNNQNIPSYCSPHDHTYVASRVTLPVPSSTISIDNKTFNVYDTPADGNCFFHAFSLFLKGNFSDSVVLRERVCQYIVDDWSNWEEKVHLHHHPQMSLGRYYSSMLNGNEWATSAEIEATAIVLGTPINVWLSTSLNHEPLLQSFLPTSNCNVPVNVLLKSNHFQLLQEVIDPIEYQRCRNANTEDCPIEYSPTQETCRRLGLKYEPPIQNETNSQKRRRTLRIAQRIKRQRISTATNESNISIPPPLSEHPQCNTTGNANTVDAPIEYSPTQETCRRLGLKYEPPIQNETNSQKRRRKSRISKRIRRQRISTTTNESNIPIPPPLSEHPQFNTTMDAIRKFELKEMAYTISCCNICNERRIDMKLNPKGICKRCTKEKNTPNMFSSENNMDPKELPDELKNLTVVEQQLLCRISPCINIHMLKHGGIASSGHCVTFSQEINEPAKIFPRLPKEINIIKVRKQGRGDSSKDFRVRRYKIQAALTWLKCNNPAFQDIQISQERLQMLPMDGELTDMDSVEFPANATHINDDGPAPQQTDPGEVSGFSHSSVLMPDQSIGIREEIEKLLNEVLENPGEVTVNNRGTATIPWPTRGNVPLSEFSTKNFFTLAFPCLFPYGLGDFHINRPISCTSMTNWADHLLWYKDGRFAHHAYFKFVVHNMLLRKRAIEDCSFIVQQKLGDGHLSISDLKESIRAGDTTIAKKILYFGANLRGTSQYWIQRARELRSLVQYKIYQGKGLPSYFTTGSCAEYHFKPLRRLLSTYVRDCTGEEINLDDRNTLFQCLQANTHIVGHYFELRTKSYFREVMQGAFGVDTYWYRMEFAKSRGMIHWHGLCWRNDMEPHSLMYEAVQQGLSDDSLAEKVSEWAKKELEMSACHPAGKDQDGLPRKDLWPPPEGSAPAPPEEKNPLIKLLMDVSESQSTLLEDYLLLSNRVNIHRCSDYCLVAPRSKKESLSNKICRMEFGTLSSPGKPLRDIPALVKDRNGSLRLEMSRDHPTLVQNSRYHTQGWRANGDISLILSKSDPKNPSVNEILATEKYITGYACKGNQVSGELLELFNDTISSADESSGPTSKSVISKLLIGTVKRDVSAVETAYELSSLPLYRCSHTFQSVSMTGARVLERNGGTVTKDSIIDKYLKRNENDSISLYGFICRQGKVPVVSGTFTQCSWPLDESYSRIKLLLHWPNWRNILDIKDENMPWVTKMTEFLNSEMCPNFLRSEVERAKTKTYNDNDQEDELVEDETDQPEWMDAIRPNADYDIESGRFQYDDGGPDYDWAASSILLPVDHGLTWLSNLNENYEVDDSILDIPDVSLGSLNDDQRFAFNLTLFSLKCFKENHSDFKPLRLIVAGTAGSGKSYLIKCIVKAVRTLFKSNKSATVICPTGNSANLISGVTLHSFLKIPTNKRSGELKPPGGPTAETLQSNCSGVKVLLVDERSLIGANTLGWMEFLCSFGVTHSLTSDTSWGGIPVVIFLGDDVQLPPVLDSPVFHCKSSSAASLHGALVWQQFKHAVTLNTIVRQNNEEQEFKNVLMSLRNSTLTSSQAKWLQKFQWSDLRYSQGANLLDRMASRGIFVFPSNNEVWDHNKSKLLDLNSKFPIAKITAISKGHHSKSIGSDNAGGLTNVLYLCKHAKVTLTVNLCVPYGLFNGSPGEVIDILYLNNNTLQKTLPDVVLVNFPGYSGPPFLDNYPTVIPVVPVERKLDCSCGYCRRKQIPLRLGWATTIHRCQGMTIGANETNRYIIIHPGTRAFESKTPGALFVALSRAKSAGTLLSDPDFAWHPSVLVNEDRLCHVVNSPTSRARAKEIQRIQDLSRKTQIEYSFLKSDNSLQNFISHIGQGTITPEE